MSLPISGFTAVPNPMMLSFLATQGFAIMYYGGAGWQFGKRKVSGMSNEEVNKMSPNDFLMKLHSETKTMVPTMAQGMQDMTPLVKTTLVLFGQYIREAIKAFPKVVQAIVGGDGGEFSNIPTTSGTGGNLPPTMASFLHYFATLSKATQGQVLAEAELPSLPKQDFSPTKQDLIDEAMLKAKLKALQTPEIKPQLSIAEQESLKLGKKKKAGQSQIMAKIAIPIEISKWKKLYITAVANGSSAAPKYLANMAAAQQNLINLLARYSF